MSVPLTLALGDGGWEDGSLQVRPAHLAIGGTSVLGLP